MKRLTPKNYLANIKNKIKLKDLAILTIHNWIVKGLTSKKYNIWPANKSLVYKERKYDIILCLPGAPIAMIALEEMIACGVKKNCLYRNRSRFKKSTPWKFINKS